MSTAAVMFHTTLAQKQGLSATEEKAIDVLDRRGPLTAKELGQHTGLAPASITGLVDRLERKGFARRIKDPQDGRRVVIELNPQNTAALAPLFEDFTRSLEELYEGYSVEQLQTILHFLTEATRIQHAATEKLTKESPSPA